MNAEKLFLDGNQVADSIKGKLMDRVTKLSRKGIVPCLATILVGENPSSKTYVRMKGIIVHPDTKKELELLTRAHD
ncbi:tetrahydrofolate dehydrogenase/cyclohydrolase catalytic domain-containing protein [Paenibacillus abyssi]|uniref:Tetrahydrofolate dehydrogenase/cyclohydrolase catalytic domain-containing protein n=1 Tax=Paenibacillus abyssi TaxID=1340531 RepID=A0A917CKE3_9BACL|nr:tetrahydrofolate dehydrogenase/cyclohydrolase catalytic domain-containing protein [Paenibacillus abyssi]GGF90422.1 hypothetical protein GCM10010916_04740 [Paenibacillus abyssi]